MKLVLYSFEKNHKGRKQLVEFCSSQKSNAVFCHQNSVANPLYLL